MKEGVQYREIGVGGVGGKHIKRKQLNEPATVYKLLKGENTFKKTIGLRLGKVRLG